MITAVPGEAPVRLIASDIDGTLLQGEERTISPIIFEEIFRLRERGILFCPASGRQYSSLRRLFAPAADILPFLCENGAVVYGPGSPGPVLDKTPIPRADALALCRDILETECEVLISGANTSYLCPKQADFLPLIRDFVGNNVALVPSPEAVPEEMVKISAYCRRGAEYMVPVLAGRWARYHPAIAGRPWLDFTLADKGKGLVQLCAALGLGTEQVMAFGDNYNDLPMLELAGRPYLMESSAPELHGRFPACRRVEDVLKSL